MQRWRRHQGFTLVESLVALSILAIALIAIIKAAGGMNVQQAELVRRMEAQWSLENTVRILRLNKSLPSVGEQRSLCTQGQAPLMCILEISNTTDGSIRRVKIRVIEANGRDDGTALAKGVFFIALTQR